MLVAVVTSSRVRSGMSSLYKSTSSVLQNETAKCTYKMRSRPIHILVTRHGLSCANIVDKFSTTWSASKYHVNMKDPLLAEGGIAMTDRAGKEVEDWLADNDLAIDAVLSSSLARAMETAAVQYPRQRIYAVPFIRESGYGKDNKAAKSDVQTERVAEEVLKRDKLNFVHIDHHWVHAFEDNHSGNWQKFKEFLRVSFLPSLESQLNKPEGEPLVLAVVTHSNFMMEGEIKKKCAKHYPQDFNTGKPKANNNQVVNLWYSFVHEKPSPSCHDATIKTRIEDRWHNEGQQQGVPVEQMKMEDVNQDHLETVGVCQAVASGTSIYDSEGHVIKLCKRDVGSWCEDQIKAKAYLESLKRSVEQRLTDNLDEQLKVQRKINKHVHTPHALPYLKRKATLNSEAIVLQKHLCLDGNGPDVPMNVNVTWIQSLDIL
eukprot:gnl/MRDRNA2_/MRDRNA2_82553_c0_seq1.p1 gnl/MRDRNA2_/MRDRNA2_82553_c0~~gnl/MRDRNA2_/MRDRNA2_82553_c0_seq1.p1  ORF type:complete len:430 (+),score=80.60 gnl/MRDRNA2_/MRDRNA2_82553_c0_seq1:124-1413(+)